MSFRGTWGGALLVFLAACDMPIGARDRLADRARTDLVTIDRWSYADGAAVTDRPARTVGAAMLRDAVVADAGVEAFVRTNGVPDAIDRDRRTQELSLAYAERRTCYVLGPGAMPAMMPRGMTGSAVRRERPLTDDEVQRIAAPPRFDREVASLRRFVEQRARVDRVLARLERGLTPPAGGGSGSYCGFTLVPATPASARALGQVDAFDGALVAWVDPGGPAAGRLAPGDRVAGNPVCSADPLTLDTTRAGTARSVTIAPARWPLAVRVALLPGQGFLLRSSPGAVGITDELLELFPSDDELAWTLAHELAHHALGHVALGDRTVPPMAPLPGTGDAADVALTSPHNQFDDAQEREADAFASRAAVAAGFTTTAGARALSTLLAKYPPGRLESLLDAAPPTTARIEALRAPAGAPGRRAAR